MNKLRPDLPPLTPRLAKLPIDERGYPIPFFVVWVDSKGERAEPGTGKPEFRAADPVKHRLCLKDKLCWVCGEPLGTYKAFVLGPMCTVNRVTSEPPSHQDCAEWSVKGCPFLAKPQMVRREAGAPEGGCPGHMIKENPGVMAIWVSKTYKPFWAGNGMLLKVGDPVSLTWWKEGRTATTEEVLAAIDVGLPRLQKVCRNADELKELQDAADRMKTMVQGGTNASVQTCG